MNFAIGILLGVCSAVMMALTGAMLLGNLSMPLAWVSLGSGAVIAGAGFYLDRTTPIDPRFRIRLGFWDWLMIGVFALFALRSFLWVAYFSGDELKTVNPNNLGDLPLHWQYIRYLAKGASFWPDNPITAHGTIGYPFGMDLLNSLFLLTGLDMIRGLVWVGLVASAVTCVMLFRWGRAFVIAGFLFNGGFAGLEMLKEWELSSWQTVDWKSIPLALFVTQRGFLFAFPAGLLLLDSWRSRLRHAAGEPVGREPVPIWLEAVLYASLPVFHLHTFLFFSVLLGCWFVFGPGTVRRHWLVIVGLALIPATAQVLWLTDFFAGTGKSAIAYHPGWMKQDDTHFFAYWFTNFGVFLPMLLWLCVAVGWNRFRLPELAWSERSVGRLFVFPAAAIFLACCFFRFAYWEWDNTKLMAWSYLVVLPFLWDVIFRPLVPLLRVPFLVLLFSSGALALIGGLSPDNNGFTICARSEIDAVQNVVDAIPVEARIATAPDHNHPLVLLGRKLTMGYAGHFSGHGLPLDQTKEDQEILMRGGADWRGAARRLEADYLFWGIREMAAYPDSARSWRKDSTVVAKGPWGSLYRLPDRN